MKIQKNIILASYTSFKIGGVADYFCETKTKEEIIKAIQWAKDKRIPYFILGGGSNILIGDKGFRGLVVKVQNSEFRIQNSKITVGTGLSLFKLLQLSVEQSLSGLEFLAGIPGTVGGAIAGNAGTKKGAISEAIEKVIILGEDGLIYKLDNNECQFGYRKSRFQKTKEIILEAVFELRKEKAIVIKKKISDVLKTRKNQPKGKTTGCIFKNPTEKPAGYLIEKVGLKGKKVGQAMISNEHSNWIINLGNAKAEDVVKLISLAKMEVKKKFNIDLEEEIRLVGEFQ